MTNENNVPEAFPHLTAIKKRFDWKMHVDKFAGGGKRLTRRTFRAYMGYLLLLFLIFMGVVGVPAGTAAFVAAFSGSTPLLVLSGFLAVVVFMGVLWFLQNAFWGFLYRFHDLGINGWIFFLLVNLALVLDIAASFALRGMGLYASVGVFSAAFSLFPFLKRGKRWKNQFGFPVEYRWYSLPTPVRVCGQAMLALAVVYLAGEVYGLLTASTTPPPVGLEQIIDMMRQQR